MVKAVAKTEEEPIENEPLVSIARDGQTVGQWPYDVAVALVRAGYLNISDHYWMEGMEDWKQLEFLLPPSRNRSKPLKLSGCENNDDVWVYYCRKGDRVVGPRTQTEILAMIWTGDITDEDALFFEPMDRWMAAGEFIRQIEQENPDFRATVQKVRELMAPPAQQDEMGAMIQNSLEAFSSSPLKGGIYVGTKVIPKLLDWMGSNRTEG